MKTTLCLVCFALLSTGCDRLARVAKSPAASTCDVSDVRFVIGPDVCAPESCAIDFGRLSPGLNDTRRVTWVGTCVQLISATAEVDDDAFRADVVDDGEVGSVFIAAQPLDDLPHTGLVSILFERTDEPFQIPVAVNVDVDGGLVAR